MSNKRTIWTHCTACTMQRDNDYEFLLDAALVTNNGKIEWLGERVDLPSDYHQADINTIDLNGCFITPGFIDCHTHVIYGGNRVVEFGLKTQGASYEDILAQGGGIYSTVEATRNASADTLYQAACQRLKRFIANGVTTVEIKSGYGLDYITEHKMLSIAKKLNDNLPLHISKTYLGAHVLAPEFEDKQSYMDYVVNEVLPQLVAEQLVDAVDIFCDKMAFDQHHVAQLFKKAQELQLGMKVHSDQLSNSFGAQVGARFQAWSADHLEYIDENSMAAMHANGTVAVLLPSAYYFLQCAQKPPVKALRAHHIPMAIATDCNPGSSPCLSLVTTLNLACVLFGLTPFEALKGVTKCAAQALGLQQSKGQLATHFDADFVAWDVAHPDELAYYLGAEPCQKVIIKGEIIYDKAK